MNPPRGLPSLAALGLLASALPALAWGPSGHRAVGQIASELVSDEVLVEVDVLLDGRSLAEVSTWADDVRDEPKYRWLEPLHYVNFDPSVGRFEHCPIEGCLIEAIERAVATLQDRDASAGERGLWLRLLVHLVGDLHQPLHVSHAVDRGGNAIRLSFLGGRDDNLHWVWDRGLLRAGGESWPRLARRLVASLDAERRGRLSAWRSGSIRTWADESYRLSVDVIYPTAPAGVALGPSYVAVFLPLVEERIVMAGVRLAWLLESIWS